MKLQDQDHCCICDYFINFSGWDPCGCKPLLYRHSLLAHFPSKSYIHRTQNITTMEFKLNQTIFLLISYLEIIYHLVVNSPSTPTGPRAWILLVLIPTCPTKTLRNKKVVKIWSWFFGYEYKGMPYLCPKSKPSAIAKSCTGIVEYSSTVAKNKSEWETMWKVHRWGMAYMKHPYTLTSSWTI